MKILLIGEYSNLHNSLKQGLVKNGHNVVLLGNGDGFKNYDADILIKSSFFELSEKSIFRTHFCIFLENCEVFDS